jgi:transglutaminase-like putative cysteine protease
MQVALRHVTTYAYGRPVVVGPQIIRLCPSPQSRTRVPAYSLTVTPAEHFLNWQQDPYSNWVARVSFPAPTALFRVEVDLVADMTPIDPFAFFVDEYAVQWPFRYPKELELDLSPYLRHPPPGPGVAAFLKGLPRNGLATVEFLVDLNRRVHERVAYGVRAEAGVQEPEETLAVGTGACRDMAWLLVHLLRQLGCAARFVSGYLIPIPLRGDGGPVVAPVDADETGAHAWADVYIPGAGWVGFDPTSGVLCAEGHLPLAAAPHYRSAALITGTVEETTVEGTFELDTRPLTGQQQRQSQSSG